MECRNLRTTGEQPGVLDSNLAVDLLLGKLTSFEKKTIQSVHYR